MFRTCLAAALALGLSTVLAHADITNLTQGTTHPTIQDAIDNANDHDEIVLDPGVYDESYIDLRGKPLTLRSQDPLNPAIVTQTILNGGHQQAIWAVNGEGPDTIIRGFVFTEGYEGPAVYVIESSPTISHCTFQSNYALENGAAIVLDRSSALITNCAFLDSYATGIGGALMIIRGAPSLRNCTFDGNEAAGGGSAIRMLSTNATLENCHFRHNTTSDAGALHIDSSDAILTDCQFSGNSAGDTGGAIQVCGGQPCHPLGLSH